MFEKLQADYQRFRELEAALLDPARRRRPVAAARPWPRSAGRWPRSPCPTAATSTSAAQIAEAEAMAEAEADPEMRSYAEAELEALRAQAGRGRRGPPRPALRPAGRGRPRRA